MKAGLCAFFFILMTGACYGADTCQLPRVSNDKYFPDLFEKANLYYTMTVDFTISNAKQSNYYVEYYDVIGKKGRVDVLEDGKNTKYYYYSDVKESFEISDASCEKRDASASVPDFMRSGMYDWNLINDERIIHGPSAMFRHAYLADKNDHSQVVYMGTGTTVRGIPSQYWRRCLRKNVTADYYFSAAAHEDVYGVPGLTEIPLKIVIDGVDDQIKEMSEKLLPQNYEIMSFAPFFTEYPYTLQLPVGLGCGRTPREDDDKIPSFGDSSLFVFAEAVYTDYSTGSGSSYTSNFMYAYDIATDYTSYFYTPWKNSEGTLEAGDPVFVVYDGKNKYVYQTSFATAECTISNTVQYTPQYTLPGDNNGYVSLTDSSMFYPNDEFHYLGEGIDRGYEVNIYEVAYPDGYILGDRVVKNSVVSHYYLKNSEIKRGPFPVEQALTRIRIGLNGTDDQNKKRNAILNFNFYGFSTRIDSEAAVFSIANCFRNDDDSMLVTIGFPAEQKDLDEILDDSLSVEYNVRMDLIRSTEITPARLPRVLVTIKEAVYVTLYVLERPVVQLDFETPKKNTIVTGNVLSTGITALGDCAYLCLESDEECWGFAHCGATCYIATGDRTKSKLSTKLECQFYNRVNFNIIPRLKVLKGNLDRLVETGQMKITVPKKTSGDELTLTANYIGPAAFGESEEMFELMGMETNPRLRVVKVASKLKSDAGERVKHLGTLTYGECQRMCLDFRACETVSYCLSSSECILSRTHGEDLAAAQIVEDPYCNLLSRKYGDSFTRSPGIVLSQNAKKTVNAATAEDCAKACAKETSFECLSFDHCPSSKDQACRLHTVHYLDVKSNEGAVTKEPVCGHYSKKWSFDFKRQSNARTLGSENSIVISTNVTLEECARLCVDYNQGTCHGFDLCQDTSLRITSTSCSVVLINADDQKTSYNAICTHFSRRLPGGRSGAPTVYSNSTAGGVGFLLFIIGCFLGALIVFGIAYLRVNRSR